VILTPSISTVVGVDPTVDGDAVVELLPPQAATRPPRVASHLVVYEVVENSAQPTG
jgi:hypothetical protein